MDSLKPLEKNFVCFDKHNISNETNTGQLKHQKINNVQRSVTNEQLRMSGNSGHYATIRDSSDENTLCTPKPRYYNATLGKRESSSDLYVSFNTGDRLPTSPNNERTPGYSYATNGEIHFLRDSNNENQQSKGTDDSDDMYLEPNPRWIGESDNDTNHSDIRISWLSEAHVYHEPDDGLEGTLTGTYDVGRVYSNKIVTAPYKKEKKLCNTCKIITCVNLVLLVAAAYIVAVLMIGQERASTKENNASTSCVQGDDVNVVCQGPIGKDECEKKLGEIFVRIYWDEETSNDITLYDMHGAELQCIARGDDGSRDKKSILLNVTTTKIQISSSASTVAIGEYFNISTELTYIQGWSTLELRKKNCSGAEITIVSIQKNDTLSNLTKESLIDSVINNTTARLTFQFRNVTCSDACMKGGDIEYISTVEIGDSWVMESERIEFKMNPSVPVLTLGQDKFYKGQEATLKCTGNIGIPTHIMSITEDSIVQKLPSSSSEIYLNPETCENVETITHEFEVKDEMDGRRYQCVTSFTNGTKLSSNVEILNVTDPILYFTEESKTGTVGNTKSIQYILNETTNLSYVVVSRFSTEETLCKVNTTGKGTCNNKAEFSVDGTLSENSGVFTTTLTIHNVSCNNKVMYSCKAIGINTLKTSMDFKVIAEPTIPNLRLPTTRVEEQMSEWEDLFKCDAFLGYPANNRMLKIENKAKGSDSFKDYITETFENGDCDRASSIEKTHKFPVGMNGSTFRCVVTDENNNILKSSTEKELRILKKQGQPDNGPEADNNNENLVPQEKNSES